MEYGCEKCPLENDESCYDYDRLGTIACGLCGSNEALAIQGQKNFISGLSREIEEMKKNK